ncbi:hypothetical protein LTS18_009853, partial [Coniosporium uncinatum]
RTRQLHHHIIIIVIIDPPRSTLSPHIYIHIHLLQYTCATLALPTPRPSRRPRTSRPPRRRARPRIPPLPRVLPARRGSTESRGPELGLPRRADERLGGAAAELGTVSEESRGAEEGAPVVEEDWEGEV